MNRLRREHRILLACALAALAVAATLALVRGSFATSRPMASRLATPLPTLVPTVDPPRPAANNGPGGYYQLQLLSVIVTVDTAETDVAAAVAVVRNGGSLHDARTDVAEAITNLRLANHEMTTIHPPASIAPTHRAVARAIAVLIQGGADILRGIDTLNAQERSRGITRFNQGLRQLQRASRVLHP